MDQMLKEVNVSLSTCLFISGAIIKSFVDIPYSLMLGGRNSIQSLEKDINATPNSFFPSNRNYHLETR